MQQSLILCLMVIGCWMGSGQSASLYANNPNIVETFGEDEFKAAVYNSDKGHFIQFYSHTCPHCRALKNKFNQFANKVQPWADKVADVVVVNCNDASNDALCWKHGVDGTPTFKYYPVQSTNGIHGRFINPDRDDSDLMANSMAGQIWIDFIEDPSKHKTWPNLDHIDENRKFPSLWKEAPSSAQYFLTIYDEQHWSAEGLKLMLDLSSLEGLYMRRSLPGKLSRQLQVSTYPSARLMARQAKGKFIYAQDITSRTANEIRALLT